MQYKNGWKIKSSQFSLGCCLVLATQRKIKRKSTWKMFLLWPSLSPDLIRRGKCITPGRVLTDMSQMDKDWPSRVRTDQWCGTQIFHNWEDSARLSRLRESTYVVGGLTSHSENEIIFFHSTQDTVVHLRQLFYWTVVGLKESNRISYVNPVPISCMTGDWPIFSFTWIMNKNHSVNQNLSWIWPHVGITTINLEFV